MVDAGEGWAVAFRERAQAHWTPTRLEALGRNLLLHPGNAPCLLRTMGVLNARAELSSRKVRKFRQLNHLLSFLKPALDELFASRDTLSIVDAGCGRSALGFLVAWYGQTVGRSVRLLGIDTNPDVIRGCRERASGSGLEGWAFEVAPIRDVDLGAVWERAFDESLRLDAVLALHACDTATDDALVLAHVHQAAFVAVAPCCQAELARAWADLDSAWTPMHKNAHFRRTMAATVTDALRVELLKRVGYDVRAVEFVEAHHTPKNTLIYGHLRAKPLPDQYDDLVRASGGVGLAVEGRLRL